MDATTLEDTEPLKLAADTQKVSEGGSVDAVTNCAPTSVNFVPGRYAGIEERRLPQLL